ncbi:MAG: hypothetical protein JW390_10003 [Nitrosopumilus sp.]|nr:hypothetical protein [Candidatus Nitrosopumilus limneticus]
MSLMALPANQEQYALYKGRMFHKIVEESSIRQKEGNLDDTANYFLNYKPTGILNNILQAPFKKNNKTENL